MVIRRSVYEVDQNDPTIFVYKNTGELVWSFRDDSHGSAERGVAFWGDWRRILIPGYGESPGYGHSQDRHGLKCFTLGHKGFELPFSYAPVNDKRGHVYGGSPDGRFILASEARDIGEACLIDSQLEIFTQVKYDFGRGYGGAGTNAIFSPGSRYVIHLRGGQNVGFYSGLFDLEQNNWHPIWAFHQDDFGRSKTGKPLLLNFHPTEESVLASIYELLLGTSTTL